MICVRCNSKSDVTNNYYLKEGNFAEDKVEEVVTLYDVMERESFNSI